MGSNIAVVFIYRVRRVRLFRPIGVENGDCFCSLDVSMNRRLVLSHPSS